jgi:hypothetical protein
MSLNYELLCPNRKELWGTLTEEEKKLYNALIWATIAADISYLCEESAPEFVRRVNALRILTKEITVDDIKKFYGLETNAGTLTSHQWAIKHFANRNQCGSAWVKKIYALSEEAYKKYHNPEN